MTTPTTFKKLGLLSTGDIAARLKVHRTTVWHWLKNGMLKSVRVTPRFRGVTEKDLAAFQANFIADPAPTPKKKAVSSKAKAPSKKAKTKKKKAAKKAT